MEAGDDPERRKVSKRMDSDAGRRGMLHVDQTRPLIRLGQMAVALYARIYHRVRIESPPRFPARGPAIVVCNHTSGLDPVLIQALSRRTIVWLMAREYYEIRAMKPFFRLIDAIPVLRGGNDWAATRKALRALLSGRILGIFPEGKIETSRQITPFADGVGMLAVRSQAPVLAAYLDGTQRGQEIGPALARRQRAVLAFAPPRVFSGKGSEATTRARKEIEQSVRELQVRMEARGKIRGFGEI